MKPETKTTKSSGVFGNFIIALIVTPLALGVTLVVIFIMMQQAVDSNCKTKGQPDSHCSIDSDR